MSLANLEELRGQDFNVVDDCWRRTICTNPHFFPDLGFLRILAGVRRRISGSGAPGWAESVPS